MTDRTPAEEITAAAKLLRDTAPVRSWPWTVRKQRRDADLLDALVETYDRDHTDVPHGLCRCWETDPPLVAALAWARQINGSAS